MEFSTSTATSFELTSDDTSGRSPLHANSDRTDAFENRDAHLPVSLMTSLERVEQRITSVLQDIDGCLSEAVLVGGSLRQHVQNYAHAMKDAQKALLPFTTFFQHHSGNTAHAVQQHSISSSRTPKSDPLMVSSIASLSTISAPAPLNRTPDFVSPPTMAVFGDEAQKLHTPLSVPDPLLANTPEEFPLNNQLRFSTPDIDSAHLSTRHLRSPVTNPVVQQSSRQPSTPGLESLPQSNEGSRTPGLDSLYLSTIEAPSTNSPRHASYTDVFGEEGEETTSLLPHAPVFSDDPPTEALMDMDQMSFSAPCRPRLTREHSIASEDEVVVHDRNASAFLSEVEPQRCAPKELRLSLFPVVYQSGLGAEHLTTVFQVFHDNEPATASLSIEAILNRVGDAIDEEMLELLLSLLVSRKYIRGYVASGRTQYQLLQP